MIARNWRRRVTATSACSSTDSISIPFSLTENLKSKFRTTNTQKAHQIAQKVYILNIGFQGEQSHEEPHWLEVQIQPSVCGVFVWTGVVRQSSPLVLLLPSALRPLSGSSHGEKTMLSRNNHGNHREKKKKKKLCTLHLFFRAPNLFIQHEFMII